MNRLKLFVSIPLLLTLYGCSSQVPLSYLKQGEVKPQIETYMEQQMEQRIPQRPSAQLYQKEIRPADIEAQRSTLLALWRKANEAELREYGINSTTLKADTPYIWTIPEGQRMPMLYLVKGEKPAKGYPLFINLHGGGKDPYAKGVWGSRSNDREWSAANYLAHRYKDSPSVYFIPRMADDHIGRWYLYPQRVAFRRIIRLAVASGLVDPDRIYLLGISEGGYGSHRLSLFMPDYFTAIGPMAAAEPPGSYEINLRHLPLRIEVGENDGGFKRNVFAKEWQHRLDSLSTLNPGEYPHFVELQKGRGHGIDYYKVAPWLSQWTKRVTYPDHITYQYYNLLDGYSRGVYYLGFTGLKPSKKATMLFDVKKQGNRYDIKTTTITGTVTGELTIYLDKINFSQPVIITLNGKTVFDGRVKPNIGAMVESLTFYGDPLRIFPALVRIPLS